MCVCVCVCVALGIATMCFVSCISNRRQREGQHRSRLDKGKPFATLNSHHFWSLVIWEWHTVGQTTTASFSNKSWIIQSCQVHQLNCLNLTSSTTSATLKFFFGTRQIWCRSPSQEEMEVIPPPSYAQVIDLNKWAIFWLKCLVGTSDPWNQWKMKNATMIMIMIWRSGFFNKMNPITITVWPFCIERISQVHPRTVMSRLRLHATSHGKLVFRSTGSASLECAMSSKMTDPLHL